MTGILEMFRALDGSDRYEMQLELWAWMRRTADTERYRDWRAANRERTKRYDAARRPPKPRRVRTAEMCRDCYEPRAPGKASCVGHLEANRQRAARAARKAA